MAPKKFYFWAASGWTLLIFILCLISFNELPSLGFKSGADKYVHGIFHFIFTVLWYLYLRRKMETATNAKILTIVALSSVAYGILIEILQGAFTETRHADIEDVLSNSAGAFLAVLLLFFYAKYRKRQPGQ